MDLILALGCKAEGMGAAVQSLYLLSVCLSISLAASLSVCQSVSLSVCVCPLLHIFSMYLSIHPPFQQSTHSL